MALDVVLNEILDQGRHRANDLLREAEREAKALRDDVEKRVAVEREKTLGHAKKDAERIRVQELARAEFEAKKKVLDAQRALWDELHGKAVDALRTLPADRNHRILKGLAKKAKAILPDGVVYARDADRAFAAEAGYSWGGARDMVGGFQVESVDGSVLLDYRYESLLEDMWKDLMRTESASLSPNGKHA